MSLNKVLEQVVAKQAEHEAAVNQAKKIGRELESLESIAAEMLGATGMDRVVCAGKSWRLEESVYVSVPKINREDVMKAAIAEGIADELTTVNTTTLKAWLLERRGGEAGEQSIAEGTAFVGLISEYREVRLRCRTSV